MDKAPLEFSEFMLELLKEREKNPLRYEAVDSWKKLRNAWLDFMWSLQIWAFLRWMEFFGPRGGEILVYDWADYSPCPALSGSKCDCGGVENGHPCWDGKPGWADVMLRMPCVSLWPPSVRYRWLWVLDVTTTQCHEQDIEEDSCVKYNKDAYNIVLDHPALTPEIIVRASRDWIQRNLPGLRGVPVRWGEKEFWRDTKH